MPSPIAHSAMGYVIYRLFEPHEPQEKSRRIGPVSTLLAITVGLSLLPDLDVIPGLLFGNINKFHNNISHSLIAGLGVALITGGIIWFRQRSAFWRWFIFTLLCYNLHVIMDFFTVGRGGMILWPFSSTRYVPSVMLFYGLHRSDGLISIHHLWTLVTEVGFAALMVFLIHIFLRVRRPQE